MVSVFIGNGCILEPYWFVESDGKPFNQNGDAYRKMLEEHTIPCMKAKFTRRELRSMYFQQDGKYKITMTQIIQVCPRLCTHNFLTVNHTQQEKFEYEDMGERGVPEYLYYIPHIAKIFWNFLLKIFLL